MSVRSYLVDAFYSLGAKINKRAGDETSEVAEGVVGPQLPSLSLDQNSEYLVRLSDTWERTWNDSSVKSKWQERGEENEKYWLGEHYSRPEADKTRPAQDNAIFQGLETYIPQLTRRNPDAMVQLAVSEDQAQPNQDFAHALQLELGELADDLNLRLKIKGAARHWSLRLLGVAKLSYSLEEDRPAIVVLRPTKIILDPDAVVDEDGYSGKRIGEHRKLPADELIAQIKGEEGSEENTKWIEEKCKGDMATEIGFIEWWTPDYFFWKCESRILKKKKNPHWNYDEQAAPTLPEAPVAEGEEATTSDEAAQEGPDRAPEGDQPEQQPAEGAEEVPEAEQAPIVAPREPSKGVNHFKVRKIPYVLISIYNLGNQPVDQTSLIGQNLSNQDLINKRIRQIDKNADNANEGLVVSLERAGLTQKQAAGVTRALRKGGVIAIPSGAPQEAIWKPPVSELPVYVYNQLVDTRTRVMDIWGLRGTTPAGLQSEKTVGGKVQIQTVDTDRIGGGVAEALEQFADQIYNWLTQMLYVYDDRFQEAIANGTPLPRVKVSVKEGSLLPKDSTTIANQAISLAQAGKMSNLDLYKRLDYPNPEELAANAWLEEHAPDLLYANDPRVKQAVQAQQQAAQAAAQAQAAAKGGAKGPSESIAFKDLPPEGKAQMAAQAGIHLNAEAIAVHAAHAEQPAPGAPPVPNLGLGVPTQ